MCLRDWTTKIFAAQTVILILAAFFLHALQVPHQHFISLETGINHYDHQHTSTNDNKASPTDLVDFPDYFHGSDKKDIFSLLLTLAAFAGLLFISWPQILIKLESKKVLNFRQATEEILVVPYICLLFALGILNPKVH